MKRIKLISKLLIIVMMFSVLFIYSSAQELPISSFKVGTQSAENESDIGAIDWYRSDDGVYYIFLPATADRANLTVWFNASEPVICGEKTLVSGEKTDVFAEGRDFTLTCGGTSYSLRVLQATDTGVIYVNTESGSLDAVHADKSHKEKGYILISDKDGNIQYDGELDYIKGRGNSTWQHAKKPYNIKLESKADLFGMGKNKSWCLLANYADASLMRNQLAYSLAREIGVETTSQTFQNELYVNGEYMGLYLLTEKVDLGENRVDIYDLEGETEDVNELDLDEYPLAGSQNSTKLNTYKYADIPNDPEVVTGGYLLELEKIYRYPDEASGFITKNGQAVVVKTPEYASKKQVQYIRGYYQEFEDALYSSTGYNSKGKHFSEYIDMTALARMYIILEFTANFDGCSSSFYLYKDVDGKLTAGPAWDFDLSLGMAMPNDLINSVPNVADPNLLYIQTCYIGNHAKSKNSLLAQAFSHYAFQAEVQKVWNGEFEACFSDFRQNIDNIEQANKASAIMNAVRWNNYGTLDINAIPSHYEWNVNSVTDYIDARYPVLKNAYSYNTFFVKYDIGKYGKALVKDTTVYNLDDEATVLPAPEATNKNIKFLGWTTSPYNIGAVYMPGDKIVIEDNTKLFAIWDVNSKKTNGLTSLLEKIQQFITEIITIFTDIFSNWEA